jgi:hypothetical protein
VIAARWKDSDDRCKSRKIRVIICDSSDTSDAS